MLNFISKYYYNLKFKRQCAKILKSDRSNSDAKKNITNYNNQIIRKNKIKKLENEEKSDRYSNYGLLQEPGGQRDLDETFRGQWLPLRSRPETPTG